jgi:hypothetical protein
VYNLQADKDTCSGHKLPSQIVGCIVHGVFFGAFTLLKNATAGKLPII